MKKYCQFEQVTPNHIRCTICGKQHVAKKPIDASKASSICRAIDPVVVKKKCNCGKTK